MDSTSSSTSSLPWQSSSKANISTDSVFVDCVKTVDSTLKSSFGRKLSKLSSRSDISGAQSTIEVASPVVQNAKELNGTSEPTAGDTSLSTHKYSLWKTIQQIRTKKIITGRDYSILGVWGHVVVLLLNFIVYGALCAVAYEYTTLMSPVSEKTVAIITILIGCCYTIIQIFLTVGYCLWHHTNSLMMTRGRLYMTIILITTSTAVILQTLLTMTELGILIVPHWLYVIMEAVKHFSWLVFLGAQVARQRLLYRIFVASAFRIEDTNMTGSFAVVILWAIYGAGSTAAIAVIQPTEHWWILMFANVILSSQAVLLALLYYSWKSRHISKAFSDWIDNLLAASNTIMLPTIYLILRITVFDSGAPSRTNPPSIETILVNTFLIFGDVSLCVVQLFGKLAFIQFSNIKIATDLDPQHLFGMDWRKHSVRVGKTAASRPATLEVPQAFNVVGGSAMNTYGPSAISSKSFECKKQQVETAASNVLGAG